MKNASPAELAALRKRAAQIAGRKEPLEAAVRRVMRQNRILGRTRNRESVPTLVQQPPGRYTSYTIS